jgi:hypothetical protein
LSGYLIDPNRFFHTFIEGEKFMQSRNSNALLWVLIALVAVLVVAVVILAIMVVNRPSAPSPAPTEEGGVVVPTQSPPDVPPPTPIPGDPEVELGAPDGRDDFSNGNNWTGFDNDCFKSEVTGGQFVLTAKGKPGFSCWEVTWPSVQDYYLQTHVVNPEACETDDRFGLFIRTPDLKAGYLVGLTCDGRLAMTKWDGENTSVLVNFVSSDQIRKGPGAANRLGVIAHGQTYQLYVNGQLIAEANDGTYVDEMRFGYFVRAASENPFTVKYDDMAIWLLEE